MLFFVFQMKILTGSQTVWEFWRILRTENRQNQTEPNFQFGSVGCGSLHQFWTELLGMPVIILCNTPTLVILQVPEQSEGTR